MSNLESPNNLKFRIDVATNMKNSVLENIDDLFLNNKEFLNSKENIGNLLIKLKYDIQNLFNNDFKNYITIIFTFINNQVTEYIFEQRVQSLVECHNSLHNNTNKFIESINEIVELLNTSNIDVNDNINSYINSLIFNIDKLVTFDTMQHAFDKCVE